jgi:peptide/nickel transport system permease protein
VVAQPQILSESIWHRSWRRFRRNRFAAFALIFLIGIHFFALAGPVVSGYSPEAIDPRNAFLPPGAEHWMGTDDVGRDTFTRIIYGARTSLLVGLASMLVSISVGMLLGSLSGYYGGWVDSTLMRFTDAMMSVPRLFLLLVILTLIGGELYMVILVIGVTSWMGPARIVRGEFLHWKEEVFVEAARAIGLPNHRIIYRHILPQVSGSIIVAATLGVAQAILIESAMSFLGLGVQPPTPTWGNMLTNAQNYVWNAPLQALFPGLMILLTVLAYNFFGDGLRDALDPKGDV